MKTPEGFAREVVMQVPMLDEETIEANSANALPIILATMAQAWNDGYEKGKVQGMLRTEYVNPYEKLA